MAGSSPRKQREQIARPVSESSAPSLRWAFWLAVVALIAASTGRLAISAGRGRTLVVLSGGPLLLMLGAMACGVVALISRAVQNLHQDAKAKEYESFRWLVLLLGAAFLVSSLIAHLYLGLRG